MFIHLAVHYPKPEHAEDLLASMKRVDAAAAGTPGLVRMNAWHDANSDRLVGISSWESREAWAAEAPRIFEAVANDPFDEWWTRPPDTFHLSPA